MGLVQWATSPWGQDVPIHIAWSLIYVAAIGGLLFLIVHAIYVRYFAKAEAFAGGVAPEVAARVPDAWPQAFTGRASVSLDHGGRHVDAPGYGLPS